MEELNRRLRFDHEPPVSNGLMLAALSGPHNVAQAATTALECLMEQAGAVRFAAADPDRFFTYDHLSPWIERNGETILNRIHWPRLEFHHAGEGEKPGPVFLTGSRPHLRMLEFADTVGKTARRCGVRNILHLTTGAGGRAHTRPTVISAIGVSEDPSPELEMMIRRIGPEPQAQPLEDAALLQACLTHGLGYVSVCGHVPEYLQLTRNHQVSLDLVRRVLQVTGTGGEMKEPERKASEFQSMLDGTMAENSFFRDMVQEAERWDDAAQAQPTAELWKADPTAMSKEIEQFLRSEREKNNEDNPQE